MQRIPDGPGWSPDGGKFWVNGGVLYWEDGDAWDMTSGGVIRTGLGPYTHEDYSAWTDERRAEVHAEWVAHRQKWKQQRDAEEAARRALIKSAKAKLTPEEFEACLGVEFYDDEE